MIDSAVSVAYRDIHLFVMLSEDHLKLDIVVS